MLTIQSVNAFTTNIRVISNLTTSDEAVSMVKQYVDHFIHLPPKQILHVRFNPEVMLRWEQMVQVCVGIRKFHNKFKVVEEVYLYVVDKKTVNLFQCLIGMFSINIKIKIINDNISDATLEQPNSPALPFPILTGPE
jgi:hypothetical protein